MAPVRTDLGRALRAMALWRLGVLLVVVYFIVACLLIFAAFALAAYVRGPVPPPTRTPLLP